MEHAKKRHFPSQDLVVDDGDGCDWYRWLKRP